MTILCSTGEDDDLRANVAVRRMALVSVRGGAVSGIRGSKKRARLRGGLTGLAR